LPALSKHGFSGYEFLKLIAIQWNLSNPTHQGAREIYRIVQDVGKLRFSFYLIEMCTKLTREGIVYI
jgi:hypothetical protein